MDMAERRFVADRSGRSLRRRQYKRPPILEATCEFRFELADAWGYAHTSAFWERAKTRYSGSPQDQQLIEIDPGLRNSDEVKPIARVKFPSANGQESVIVAPGEVGRLSVHVRRPYTGWDIFREQARQALSWYAETIKVVDVRRIGVRYINVIEPADEADRVDKYVVTSACKVGSLDLDLKVFQQRFEYEFRDEPVKALVTLARVEGADANGFLLDIDVIQEWKSRGPKLDQAMAALDVLRNREREVFESLITPAARRSFDA